MSSLTGLRAFLREQQCKVVIAADGQTRMHTRRDGGIVERTAAGGVPVAFDRVSQVVGATYVGRARSEEDLEVLDADGKIEVGGGDGRYSLKRVPVNPQEADAYYYGYSNQSLWPLFHTAYEKPVFDRAWFVGYRRVNRRFAEAIRDEIDGRTLVWVNDYQLSLVPAFLPDSPDMTVAFFWHIPWPGWDTFRILPQRRAILKSLLRCDFIGFHTTDYARNFLDAAERELGASVDPEALTADIDGRTVRLAALPVGIDTDVIRERVRRTTVLLPQAQQEPSAIRGDSDLQERLKSLCSRYEVVLGVDRLDYTKGIPERLQAISTFFERHPEYLGRLVYVGVMSPTRDKIPAYQNLRSEVVRLGRHINRVHGRDGWEPLHLFYDGLPRDQVLGLYACGRACLVTPLSDGMNLVAKEYVTAASCMEDPGMLVLSAFAGASTQLTDAVAVNPFSPESVADGLYTALTMPDEERRERIGRMSALLERDNVYVWAERFLKGALSAAPFTFHRVA